MAGRKLNCVSRSIASCSIQLPRFFTFVMLANQPLLVRHGTRHVEAKRSRITAGDVVIDDQVSVYEPSGCTAWTQKMFTVGTAVNKGHRHTANHQEGLML